jgi:DNA-binding YbaB/EbfC family protein
MKDLGGLMKQAQAMQENLKAAQAELARKEVEGAAGGDMVRLTLTGEGVLSRLTIDESLLAPGEGEIIAVLIIAAHADASRKLETLRTDMMKSVAGPLAGLPGMPKF